MPADPATIEELDNAYLSAIARRLLGDPEVEVTGFQLIADPFEFPRFGEKRFYLIEFGYRAGGANGRGSVILRVMPEMDAVMMLTGDTEHRELKAFNAGLYQKIPKTFHIPYLHVIDRPERGQFWAFVEDVRPEMAALGMHAARDPATRQAIDRLYREPEGLLQKVSGLPITLCHYDFDNRNLGMRNGPEGPQTVVIDWEILGQGLSSADVVRFLSYQQPPNA